MYKYIVNCIVCLCVSELTHLTARRSLVVEKCQPHQSLTGVRLHFPFSHINPRYIPALPFRSRPDGGPTEAVGRKGGGHREPVGAREGRGGPKKGRAS